MNAPSAPPVVPGKIGSMLHGRNKLKYLADKRRAAGAVVSARMNLLQWTAKHRKFLSPERPFRSRPYLDALYEDDAREIVVCKASQLGTSEYLVSYILFMADVNNCTGLYVFPTDTHVSDFSAARFGPAVEANVSPYLASIIVSGDARGADRVGLKRVRNRFVYFRGGKVAPDGRAPQLKSVDADVVIVDEVDECDPRAIPIVRKRLEASAWKNVRLVSTPTYPEVGIHGEYLRSDQRSWHVKCLSCGKMSSPTLESLILESDGLGRPTRWHGQEQGIPFLACKHCGGVLDRDSGLGEWVAAYPSRGVHGYHMLRLALAGSKPLQETIDALQQVDETKRQQEMNQGIGLTYTPTNSRSLSATVLDNCRRDYGHGAVDKEQCYAGIDVGGSLHMVIRSVLHDGQRAQRFAGTFESFDEASYLLRQFNVKTCVVDALPETRAARAFQAKNKGVWLAYYGEGEVGNKKEMVGAWNGHEHAVNVDRTRALDEMFSRFCDSPNARAENTLPANARNLPDYYEQMCASIRVLRKNAAGTQVPAYVEKGPDHYAHAENYCYVASTCPYSTGWARGSA